ncbi:hypothetical protein Taro_028597 [Colocasia esculenta]|uniref:Uncharacterized protein n=1 Tax=Colocasia esculenta TaxID=4460 RepID=A0A843VLI5_COLES|nr:hypothetical protein [Colocasia esculenta]
MAKKNFNESRKSSIQKIVALSAHSMSSKHSSSSSEHKSSNGSTRSGISRFGHGSVDTLIDGVDTGASHEERDQISRKGCGGCRKGKRGAEQCCLEGDREEEEKRRGDRIKHQHPEREQSSAIRLRSRRAAKEEEELAIRMPLKQSIVD